MIDGNDKWNMSWFMLKCDKFVDCCILIMLLNKIFYLNMHFPCEEFTNSIIVRGFFTFEKEFYEEEKISGYSTIIHC